MSNPIIPAVTTTLGFSPEGAPDVVVGGVFVRGCVRLVVV